MNTIDVIVGLLLAYSLFRGLTKGFIIEISGMIALFLGIMGAFKFSSYIGKHLSSYVDWNPKIIQAVSFILLFIGIIYAISLLAKMLTKALKIVALGGLNRLIGGLFGVIKWCVILSALTLVFKEINSFMTLMSPAILEESIAYPFLKELGDFLFDWVLQNQTLQEQQIVQI
jgi:membrane protein required for colicin V production